MVENARLDRRDHHIASAFIERIATDPNPFLFSTGTGPGVRRRNNYVVGISTNFGSVSEDILNRSLPIHLNPVGNISERNSPIGNPKLEFVPAHRDEIAAELRGMIVRWVQAGRPKDTDVRHPFSVWAAVVGGILRTNGFRNFLGNYGRRRVADDPVRRSLGILGAGTAVGEWRRPDEWARDSTRLGVIKDLVSSAERDSMEGRKRGIGVTLSAHRDETFQVETDAVSMQLRLEKKRSRFGESEPHTRYRFVVVSSVPLPND